MHGKQDNNPNIAPHHTRRVGDNHITMSKYVCPVCGWEYRPEEGELELDIEPGTPFELLPDDFVCPVCGVEKEEFTEE